MTEILLPDLERLPIQEQERIVTGWLARSNRNLQAFSYAMRWAEQRMTEHAAPLPQRLSELMLGHLQRYMLAVPKTDYSTHNYFPALARVLDTGNLAYTTANWPPDDWEHWPQWRPMFDGLMETLTFRHTMQASFLENHA